MLENEISPPVMVNLKIYCKNKMINGRGEFQAAVSIRIKIFIRVRTHSQTSRLIKHRWWSWIRRIARVSVCENRKRELFPYVVSREGGGRERGREKRDRLDCGGLKKNPKSRRFFNYIPHPSFQTHEPMHDVRCMYICVCARNVSD